MRTNKTLQFLPTAKTTCFFFRLRHMEKEALDESYRAEGKNSSAENEKYLFRNGHVRGIYKSDHILFLQ